MGIPDILTSVDRQIALLKQARALLAGTPASAHVNNAGKRGKSAVQVSPGVAKPGKKRKKRVLTPEGRKAIADAQRKRWQAQKKAVPVPAK
jgi:predicted KAP-like P-loop ATPase